MPLFPKISIITPSYNLGNYIEKTIQSVLNQNYPNLEYIIIDGGSTDKTVSIIKKYEKHLSYWISEPDNGMYDALQKGFGKSTGDIMGWINADDAMHSGSLNLISELFHKFNNIEWITGFPTCFDECGRMVNLCNYQKLWTKYNFYYGDYKWIQQESTFWRRSLWEKAGSYIDSTYKLAGDLELWSRYFKHAKLFCVEAGLAGYRIRKDQLSIQQKVNYQKEAEAILAFYKKDFRDRKKLIKMYFLKHLLRLNLSYIKNLFYKQFDYPPKIVYNRSTQTFTLSEKFDFCDFTIKTTRNFL